MRSKMLDRPEKVCIVWIVYRKRAHDGGASASRIDSRASVDLEVVSCAVSARCFVSSFASRSLGTSGAVSMEWASTARVSQRHPPPRAHLLTVTGA